MTVPTFVDLAGIEIEYLVSEATLGGIVKIRCKGEGDVILLGHIDPVDARRIAGHILECATRAEYEADFVNEARRADMPDEAIAAVMRIVRAGEHDRHVDAGDGDWAGT